MDAKLKWHSAVAAAVDADDVWDGDGCGGIFQMAIFISGHSVQNQFNDHQGNFYFKNNSRVNTQLNRII